MSEIKIMETFKYRLNCALYIKMPLFYHEKNEIIFIMVECLGCGFAFVSLNTGLSVLPALLNVQNR